MCYSSICEMLTNYENSSYNSLSYDFFFKLAWRPGMAAVYESIDMDKQNQNNSKQLTDVNEVRKSARPQGGQNLKTLWPHS